MQAKRYIGIAVVMLMLALPACRKLDLAPSYQETDLDFWKRPDAALNTLNTVYAQMYSDEYFFFNEDLSDNAFCVSQVNGGRVRNIAEGAYDGRTDRVAGEWAFHYSGIRGCNNLLANIDKVPGLTDVLRSRIIAETRFIRAFHYFNLYTWYGDVPLITTEISFDESFQVKRAPKTEVMNFVLSELDFCEANLPTNVQYGGEDKGRVTKGAAIALKARAYLYDGKWQEVITNCEKLIGTTENGTYGLVNDYAGLFTAANEYSKESILEIVYIPAKRTHNQQRFFIPRTEGQLICGVAPSQELVDDYVMINGKAIGEAGSGYDEENPYENRDPRFYATIVYDGANWTRRDGSIIEIRTAPGTGNNSVDNADATPTGYYVAKYYDKTADGANNSGLNLMLIRYADVLLMYAEAKNELTQMNAQVWDNTIGALRKRAGFTDIAALNFNAALSQSELREVIRRERRTELAMEGLRVFDIRRWRIAENVLNGTLHGFKVDGSYLNVDNRVFDKNKHYLWPVPQNELDLNPNLKPNNPGW
ncbi:MAG TPA: RagB/SusD family nutrient uptake outer membrane protein [Chitinophagaceae bacterium]